MRVLVTGGSGVLGRAALPLLRAAGHEVHAPGHAELDLFDPAATARAVDDCHAVMHLATRIPPTERMEQPGAWQENDRLRTAAARLLVDAALARDVQVFVQPTIAFVYPPGLPADEESPVDPALRQRLRSAIGAEQETARFAAAGRRGVVLRFGLLDGPGTGNDEPLRIFGTTLHVTDAGRALLAALELPSGIYNAVRDGEPVRNAKLRAWGWQPSR